jgi:DNA-binding IclR family transcriptional regulator
MRVEEAALRLKGAFLEMPGTQLSLSEAARLTGLEQDTCRVILSTLEDIQFLRQRDNGVFVRRTGEPRDA